MRQDNVAPKSAKNSKLKGGIAIALGAALLAGGGGTLAYWSASEKVAASKISTGDLDLALGTAVWTLTDAAGNAETLVDLANLELVPGDTLELRQPLDVTLKGENLKANLTVDTTGFTVTDNIDVTTSLDLDGAVLPLTAQQAAASNIVATVTVAFDPDTASRDDAGIPVDLDEIKFNLTQVEG